MPSDQRSGRFGQVVTAMVTPFTDSGELDLDAAQTLARHLQTTGSTGLVVAGSTGEGSVLSDEEKLNLFAAVAEAVTIPVLGGSSSNDTPHSIQLSERASKTGLAGLLLVTPYYNRPPVAGIRAHFAAVAEVTTLPIVLYDIPIRTGRRITTEVIYDLATTYSHVVAVKDATGDLAAAGEAIAGAPSHLEWYSGDDAVTLAFVALGAKGVISVASHWAAPEFRAMIDAAQRGDLEEAREWNARLLPSYRFESSDLYPNPLPAKAVMRVLGHKVGQCRLPMGAVPSSLDDAASELLSGLDASRG